MVFLLAEILIARVNRNNIRPLSGCVLQVIIQSIVMPLVDDRRVIRIILDLREHLSNSRLCFFNKTTQLLLGDHGVIRRKTDLTCIHRLTSHYISRGHR